MNSCDSVPLTLNKEQFVKKCEEVYMKNRRELESKHQGKLVALYEEGIAAIGDNIDRTLQEARKNKPGKVFYTRRIGDKPAVAILF